MSVPYMAPAQVEARAAELTAQYALDPGFDLSALLDTLKIDEVWEEVDDGDGKGAILGQLIPGKKRVVINERHRERLERDGEAQLRFTIAHEIGHWILHSRASALGAMSLFDRERIWCREGSADPAERQAEAFAAALLIPKDHLRTALPLKSWKGWPPVYALAGQFRVSPTAMKIRLEQLEWAHIDEGGEPVSGPKPRPGQSSLPGL